jgi:hypothetical protein
MVGNLAFILDAGRYAKKSPGAFFILTNLGRAQYAKP